MSKTVPPVHAQGGGLKPDATLGHGPANEEGPASPDLADDNRFETELVCAAVPAFCSRHEAIPDVRDAAPVYCTGQRLYRRCITRALLAVRKRLTRTTCSARLDVRFRYVAQRNAGLPSLPKVRGLSAWHRPYSEVRPPEPVLTGFVGPTARRRQTNHRPIDSLLTFGPSPSQRHASSG